jgi:hypothetical protein
MNKWEPIPSVKGVYGYELKTPWGSIEVTRAYQGEWGIFLYSNDGKQITKFNANDYGIPVEIFETTPRKFPSYFTAKAAANRIVKALSTRRENPIREKIDRFAKSNRKAIPRMVHSAKAVFPMKRTANPKKRGAGDLFIVSDASGCRLATFAHKDDAVKWARGYANRHGVRVRVESVE